MVLQGGPCGRVGHRRTNITGNPRTSRCGGFLRLLTFPRKRSGATVLCMYTYVVRVVRAEEWASVKALRLLALEDPAAPLAFLETYETAAERPDSFWQKRAADAAA